VLSTTADYLLRLELVTATRRKEDILSPDLYPLSESQPKPKRGECWLHHNCWAAVVPLCWSQDSTGVLQREEGNKTTTSSKEITVITNRQSFIVTIFSFILFYYVFIFVSYFSLYRPLQLRSHLLDGGAFFGFLAKQQSCSGYTSDLTFVLPTSQQSIEWIVSLITGLACYPINCGLCLLASSVRVYLSVDYANWRQEKKGQLKCPSEALLLLFVNQALLQQSKFT